MNRLTAHHDVRGTTSACATQGVEKNTDEVLAEEHVLAQQQLRMGCVLTSVHESMTVTDSQPILNNTNFHQEMGERQMAYQLGGRN